MSQADWMTFTMLSLLRLKSKVETLHNFCSNLSFQSHISPKNAFLSCFSHDTALKSTRFLLSTKNSPVLVESIGKLVSSFGISGRILEFLKVSRPKFWMTFHRQRNACQIVFNGSFNSQILKKNLQWFLWFAQSKEKLAKWEERTEILWDTFYVQQRFDIFTLQNNLNFCPNDHQKFHLCTSHCLVALEIKPAHYMRRWNTIVKRVLSRSVPEMKPFSCTW